MNRVGRQREPWRTPTATGWPSSRAGWPPPLSAWIRGSRSRSRAAAAAPTSSSCASTRCSRPPTPRGARCCRASPHSDAETFAPQLACQLAGQLAGGSKRPARRRSRFSVRRPLEAGAGTPRAPPSRETSMSARRLVGRTRRRAYRCAGSACRSRRGRTESLRGSRRASTARCESSWEVPGQSVRA